MTCRIRADKVARPLTRLHPKGCSTRSWRDRPGDPSCLGPPLLPMQSCRPVIRVAAGLGVRPDRPAAAAGSCRQTGIFTYECPKSPTESGICGVTHHSPVRVNAAVFEGVSRGCDPRTSTGTLHAALGVGVLCNPDGRTDGAVPTLIGGTSFGPFRPRPGRFRVCQLSEGAGMVTRAVRRSPSNTRSARASVGACSSVSPR